MSAIQTSTSAKSTHSAPCAAWSLRRVSASQAGTRERSPARAADQAPTRRGAATIHTSAASHQRSVTPRSASRPAGVRVASQASGRRTAMSATKATRSSGSVHLRNADHSQAPIRTTTVRSATVASAGSQKSTTSSSAIRTAAVRTRLRSDSLTGLALSSLGRRRGLASGPGQLTGREAEASLPAGEKLERGRELRLVEVGPEPITEIELRVGDVPEEEVADPPLAAGADQQVRIRQPAELERGGEALLVDVRRAQGAARALGGELTCGLHDVPASAVAHGHLQLQARIGARALLRGADLRLQPHREALPVADEAHAHALAVQLRDLAIDGLEEQAHEARHLLRRPRPVLAREGEEGQRLDAEPAALLDTQAHRCQAGLVACRAGQAARGGPPAVAIHRDGDVPGHGVHHTCITSFSFAARSCSMSATCLSVSFWISPSARRSSSCEIIFSFSMSLTSLITSRRTLRTATRAFSASCRSTLVISRRRSSVRAGIGMRITVPAVIGVRPRSDLKMAFSIACTTVFSHGETTSVRPSSMAMLATCCSGTSEP